MDEKLMATGKKKHMLAVLGIAVGVYSVLIILAVSATGQEFMNTQLDKMGFNCITIAPADKTLNRLSTVHLDILLNEDSVSKAAPLMTNFGQATARELIGSCGIIGVDPATTSIAQISVIYGTNISEEHVENGDFVCVVDETMAQNFFGRSNVVNKNINIVLDGQSYQFKIVGVADDTMGGLTSLMGGFVPTFVFIPYTTQMMLTESGTIDQIFLEVANNVDFDIVGEELSDMLSSYDGHTDLYIYNNMVSQKEEFNRIFSGVTIVLTAIAGISFFVSGINIMTIMLSTVTEKTREIGIKKAIGATKTDIVIEFLLEGFWISIKGGVIGTCLLFITMFTAGVLGTEMTISPIAPVIVLFFAVLCGVVFGISPACTAAELEPVQALKRD